MDRSPYFIEVRISGETGDYLNDIIEDIADQFGVQGMVRNRPVPHITLFGPYNTNAGGKAKRIIEDVCSEFDIVPYCLRGFGHFRDDVIYVDVEPSPELRQLRRELSKRLRGVSYNYPNRDANKYHAFHVTIAKRDISDQFEEIWEYVNCEYSPEIDEYATRITSLRGRNMIHEYDLLQDRFIPPDEATSYQKSWKETLRLLDERQSQDDFKKCSDLSPMQKIRYRIEGWIR